MRQAEPLPETCRTFRAFRQRHHRRAAAFALRMSEKLLNPSVRLWHFSDRDRYIVVSYDASPRQRRGRKAKVSRQRIIMKDGIFVA